MGININVKYKDEKEHLLFRTFSTDKTQPIQLWADWFRKLPNISEAKQEVRQYCESCKDVVTFNRVNLDE